MGGLLATEVKWKFTGAERETVREELTYLIPKHGLAISSKVLASTETLALALERFISL